MHMLTNFRVMRQSLNCHPIQSRVLSSNCYVSNHGSDAVSVLFKSISGIKVKYDIFRELNQHVLSYVSSA